MGILIGEGHFGGDGKQPQITLRMHIRHERIFRWLEHLVPGSKVYGPYKHVGRQYYQWMARGAGLKALVQTLRKTTFQYLDPYSYERFLKMVRQYKLD